MDVPAIDISQSDIILKELISRHGPRAKIVVKDGDRVVGRLLLRPREDRPKPERRVIGLHKGSVLYMADDFDVPLPDEFWLSGEP
jgi:hypothetical protein